jgi:prepilin-type N-terminal cleavage/methylation domain-containing protein
MRSLNIYNQGKRGFSLIEMLVVLGLVALVAGASVSIAFNSVGRSSVLQERDYLVSLLHAQRGAALSNIDESPHGLHIASSTYVLFKGSSYNASDPANRSVSHGTLAFTGTTDIIFAQLSGDVLTGQGTLTLAGSGQTQSIDINAYGQIDW